VPDPEAGHLPELGCQLAQPSLALQAADRAQLDVGSAARAHDVGVVGVREAVRTGPRRRDDSLLAEAQRRLLRAEEGEQLPHGLGALGVGKGVMAALVHRHGKAILLRKLGQEGRRVRRGGAQLEVRVSRAADRPRGEEGAAKISGPAAGSGDDPPGRSHERGQVCVEDAGLVQRLQGPGVVLEVELIARASLEGAAPVGSNLAGHPVGAKEREGTARGGAARQLEMHPDAAAAAEMHAARPAHERGELGQPAAGLTRFDRRKLLPDVFRKGHRTDSGR
jgi:hypothetical protein